MLNRINRICPTTVQKPKARTYSYSTNSSVRFHFFRDVISIRVNLSLTLSNCRKTNRWFLLMQHAFRSLLKVRFMFSIVCFQQIE